MSPYKVAMLRDQVAALQAQQRLVLDAITAVFLAIPAGGSVARYRDVEAALDNLRAVL